ncbi:hypothetical protein KR222_011239 [Zaprionus bogoriensis]|nr:hypothetical protein KR222_011239 [Zaprionus bogoriensis]
MPIDRQLCCLLLLLCALLLAPVRPAAGECCKSKGITFRMSDKGDLCDAYDAKTKDEDLCQVDICEDGTPVNWRYCGVGPCNIFGCRCAGGCRKGNGLNSFIEFYGNYHIRDVRYV